MYLQLFGKAFGALVLGCALRTLLPWLTTWLQTMSEDDWPGWLKFEPKYIANFALAVIGYGVTLLISDGAFEMLSSLRFVPAVAVGYAGGDLAREAIKLLVPRLR